MRVVLHVHNSKEGKIKIPFYLRLQRPFNLTNTPKKVRAKKQKGMKIRQH
jgi:hypothetical protein